MKVNGKNYPIYEMENRKCLKPPTRLNHRLNAGLVHPWKFRDSYLGVHWLSNQHCHFYQLGSSQWLLGSPFHLGKLSHFTNLNLAAMNGGDFPIHSPWIQGLVVVRSWSNLPRFHILGYIGHHRSPSFLGPNHWMPINKNTSWGYTAIHDVHLFSHTAIMMCFTKI